MMLKVVYKYIHEPDMREDVFQEAFIRLIKCEDKLRKLTSEQIDAFIILIIRYVVIDYYRKMHYDKTITFENDVLLNIIARKEMETGHCVNAFGKVELSMMMQQLTEEERILIIGKYYLGLSIAELCDIVGGSPERIRTRLFRAKERIQVLWQKSGLKMEDFLNG
jgi:RNA polymerase sigma-70 factor (ECF subfamily)